MFLIVHLKYEMDNSFVLRHISSFQINIANLCTFHNLVDTRRVNGAVGIGLVLIFIAIVNIMLVNFQVVNRRGNVSNCMR